MEKKRCLVIGGGQIGLAIAEIWRRRLVVDVVDTDPQKMSLIKLRELELQLKESKISYNYVHICIPYTDDFISNVMRWYSRRAIYVNYSTVIPGTSAALEVKLRFPVIYSPVIGKHPDLVSYMLQPHPIAIAGIDEIALLELMDDMRALRMRPYVFYSRENDQRKNLEAAKNMSLIRYAHEVKWAHDLHAWCELHLVDFNVVHYQWTELYNEVYRGDSKFQRSLLDYVSGPIGGHCVTPAVERMSNSFELADDLRKWIESK